MAKHVILTKEQIAEIENSKQTYSVLAKKFKVSNRRISDIKIKAGTNVGRGQYGKVRIVTEAEKRYILESKDHGGILSKELGVSIGRISLIRREAGIGFGKGRVAETKNLFIKDKVIKEKKPKKQPKPKPKPKTIKEKVVKVKPKKELPIKIIKPVKKDITPIKESQYQYEQKQLAKAKKTAEQHKQTEADKLKEGWKWITVPGRFNIKETKFVSPEDYTKLKATI